MEEVDPRQEAVRRLQQDLEQGFEYNGQPNGPPIEWEALPFSVWRKRPRPPKEELLGPLVVKGQRFVLGAATGEGKSTIIWWIVKALATGGRFLDWHAKRPCRVLIVDAEQGDHDIERLMDETRLGELDNCFLIHAPDGLSLNSSGEERQRLEMILQQGQFDVVVLDPLYKLHTGDPNDEREAVALMRLFDRWRTQFGFNLMIPSHMRKPSSGGKQRDKDFTMHEIFGASAYLRGAETVVGIKLISDGLSHLHFFKTRSPGLPVRTHWPLRYNRHTGFTIWESPNERAQRERDVAVQKIRSLLEEAGGAGVEWQMLAGETGRGRTFVFDVLKELMAVSFSSPISPKVKLWMLPDQTPDQQDMEIMAETDDDE